MKNFKEIAEKCLNGELSGRFITKGGFVLSSNRLQNLRFFGFYRFTQFFDSCCYNELGKCINNKSSFDIVNFIPDMKENDKRIIQISLQQAREWYNSGNDTLKALALSSFSKKELDPYPRSFNEYFEKYSNGSNILKMYPTKELQEKFNAYIKLMSLRYDWIHIWSQEQNLEKDWIPVWGNSNKGNYCIEYNLDRLEINNYVYRFHSISFPIEELAYRFRDCFKSLLEQAKGLY